MTATPSGWECPDSAQAARGELEQAITELTQVRDFSVQWLVGSTLPNTLAGDRMRAGLAGVETALTELGKALDTI